MTQYVYRAMNPKGRFVLGRMDAINLVDLELRLKRMELDFINGEPVRHRALLAGGRISRRELINFCFHLEQLTKAGVPVHEGLTDLRDSLENPRFREIIAGIIESIDGGKTLSQALALYPQAFDNVFVSLVQAGEETGNLQEVLTNMVESLKWQDELAAHLKKLVTYPAFLAVVVLGITLFMMLYLVPRMVGFIKNMGHQLPTHTKVLIATSDFMVHYWYLVLGLPTLAVIAISIAAQVNPQVRYRVDAFKLGLPMIGDILRKIALSRFAGVFAMMYASGISILDSLRTTENVVGNAVIREGLQRVGALIGEGQTVTGAFHSTGMFPPLVVRMMRVGESTGRLDTALTNVGYFYTRDVRESVGRVQAMIEPAMTVIVGSILGWVMLSVLGPIYDVITKLKM